MSAAALGHGSDARLPPRQAPGHAGGQCNPLPGERGRVLLAACNTCTYNSRIAEARVGRPARVGCLSAQQRCLCMRAVGTHLWLLPLLRISVCPPSTAFRNYQRFRPIPAPLPLLICPAPAPTSTHSTPASFTSWHPATTRTLTMTADARSAMWTIGGTIMTGCTAG